VLVDGTGVQLGTLTELDMSSGNSLATAGEVWSTCLHFNGNFVDVNGKQQTLQAGKVYGLKVQMYGPLAAADVALGLPRPMTEVGGWVGERVCFWTWQCEVQHGGE
jgi:hypothetical protein